MDSLAGHHLLVICQDCRVLPNLVPSRLFRGWWQKGTLRHSSSRQRHNNLMGTSLHPVVEVVLASPVEAVLTLLSPDSGT